MSIYKGETLGLVGESGSGKSTLSKIVLGLEKASQGQVDFPGLTAEELNSQALQVIYQDPLLPQSLSISFRTCQRTALFVTKEGGRREGFAMLERVGIQGMLYINAQNLLVRPTSAYWNRSGSCIQSAIYRVTNRLLL